MNPLLQVKLRFTGEKNNQKPGARNLRAKAETSTEKIDELTKRYPDHKSLVKLAELFKNELLKDEDK